MSQQHQPNLTPSLVDHLAAHTCLSPDELPGYGARLSDVIKEGAPESNWLAAALLAGYVPEPDDIALALEALHLAALDGVQHAASARRDDEAGALAHMPVRYREMVIMLERFVAEMEHVRAHLERQYAGSLLTDRALPPAERRTKHTIALRQAKAAQRRITRAIRRMGIAEADNLKATSCICPRRWRRSV